MYARTRQFMGVGPGVESEFETGPLEEEQCPPGYIYTQRVIDGKPLLSCYPIPECKEGDVTDGFKCLSKCPSGYRTYPNSSMPTMCTREGAIEEPVDSPSSYVPQQQNQTYNNQVSAPAPAEKSGGEDFFEKNKLPILIGGAAVAGLLFLYAMKD